MNEPCGRRRNYGCRRISRGPAYPIRRVLTCILFVLRNGIRWELLPQAPRYGSGMICRRRLQE
ncbi:MAG: transposase [Verrucomicrobia bacterium]|nr:transposase [Verrucomicrobiota bacterium]